MATSRHAARAREGGFEKELRHYVEAVARVQSQMICGRCGVGYEHAVLFPGRERDKQAEAEWFEQCRAQAATGSIKVSVPRELLEGWKGHAMKGDRGR